MSVTFQGKRYWKLSRMWHDHELVAVVAGVVLRGETIYALLGAHISNLQPQLFCYKAIDWEVKCQVGHVTDLTSGRSNLAYARR